MQVFPGDAIDADAVRALIEELASHGLVRLYSVAGQDYIAVVDWPQLQRVGKRARRRYPEISEADQRLTPALPAVDTIENHRIPRPAARIASHSNPPLGAGLPPGQIQDCLTPARGDTDAWPRPEERPQGASRRVDYRPDVLPMLRDGRCAASSA
jgi:hypothetical protein